MLTLTGSYKLVVTVVPSAKNAKTELPHANERMI
jgi:hypothetical protein